MVLLSLHFGYMLQREQPVVAEQGFDAGDALEKVGDAFCVTMVGSVLGREEGSIGVIPGRVLILFEQSGEWRIQRVSLL